MVMYMYKKYHQNIIKLSMACNKGVATLFTRGVQLDHGVTSLWYILVVVNHKHNFVWPSTVCFTSMTHKSIRLSLLRQTYIRYDCSTLHDIFPAPPNLVNELIYVMVFGK